MIQTVSCVEPLKVWFFVSLSSSFLFLVLLDEYTGTIYILLFTFIYSCFSMNDLQNPDCMKSITVLLGKNLEAGPLMF